MFNHDDRNLMDRHHLHQHPYQGKNNNNYGSLPESSNHHRQTRSSGGKSSPPNYSTLTPDFDIGPPSSKPYTSSYGPMSSEPNTRSRKSYPGSDLPPSYDSVVSPSMSPSVNNNNTMMESKRREYLQQKLTHLKKQNSTSLEHFNIVREDVRQSKDLMEKQILHAYGAMKQHLEVLLQDSLRSLQDMEVDMTEPLENKIDQLKRNMRSIDMTESILNRQPFSESVKEKVDNCLKSNIPPFSSDIDICKLTDQNNFPLLRTSSSLLTDSHQTMKNRVSTSKNEAHPRYEKYDMYERENESKYDSNKFVEREKYSKKAPPFDLGFDDSKSDISVNDNDDFDYRKEYMDKKYNSTNRRLSPDYPKREEKKKNSISDSVIGSYQQLEDLYSQTKNCAVFKGSNF